MNQSACLLCGNDRITEVRVSLARWRDGNTLFSAVPRCVDRKACRARCESYGEDWPVVDPDELYYEPRTVSG